MRAGVEVSFNYWSEKKTPPTSGDIFNQNR